MLHFLMASTCSVPPCLAFRFVNSFVYYGLSLNVTNFGLDIYLTQLAFGAVEIPARVGCIFTLQRFGRRKTQTVLLVLSGLVCLIITGIPEGEQPCSIRRGHPWGQGGTEAQPFPCWLCTPSPGGSRPSRPELMLATEACSKKPKLFLLIATAEGRAEPSGPPINTAVLWAS